VSNALTQEEAKADEDVVHVRGKIKESKRERSGTFYGGPRASVVPRDLGADREPEIETEERAVAKTT